MVGFNNATSNPSVDDGGFVDLVPCGSGDLGASTDQQISRKYECDADCEAVLDAQESFVSCVEGVSLQHEYDQKTSKPFTIDTVDPDEAAMIRLQAMEQEQQRMHVVTPPPTSTMPELDLLSINLCGTDSEDIDDQRIRSRHVVSPNGETKESEVEQTSAVSSDEPPNSTAIEDSPATTAESSENETQPMNEAHRELQVKTAPGLECCIL